MRKAKTPRQASRRNEEGEKGREEAVTFLATLAAKIAPDLCRSDPKRAIEAALARLIECAREQLEREQEGASLANERAQLEAEAERADKYGFNLTGGNLSLEDAFHLQKKSVAGKETDRDLIKPSESW